MVLKLLKKYIKEWRRVLIYLWIPLLFKKPKYIKYLRTWVASLKSDAITDGIPWLTFEANEWLGSFLNKNMTVFEWGSGGSTLYISKRAKKLISIEHNPKWYKFISNKLKKNKINNCQHTLIEPIKLDGQNQEKPSFKNYLSNFDEYKGFSFEKYVKSIDPFPDESFDLVIVDGRVRPSCIFHAKNKLKKGGFLLLDDSERKDYLEAIDLLKNWQRKNFYGIAPGNKRFSQTSIWEKLI